MKIEKVTQEDFDDCLPLLQRFDSRFKAETWKRLFTNYWSREEDYYGFKLIYERKVVGFFGLLFSSRQIKGKSLKFANMTSWIVEPDFRSYSILLLNEVLKLTGYCLTNFSASDKVIKMLKKFGFKVITNEMRIILPSPSFFNKSIRSNHLLLFWDSDSFSKKLSNDDIKILNDHNNFRIIPILFEVSDNYSFVIFRKITRKKIPFLLIHYISNKDFFIKVIKLYINKLCMKYKVCGIIVQKNFLGNEATIGIKIKLHNPQMYRGENVEIDEIDTLYSELLVLDL